MCGCVQTLHNVKTNYRKYHYDQNDRTQFHNHHPKGVEWKIVQATGIGVAVAGLIYGLKNYELLQADAEAEENPSSQQNSCNDVGRFIEGLPVYSSEEVAKHQDDKSGIWISYKSGVYDITSFIQNHPGGTKIMLAAGGSVEPFWSLYAVHKKPEILSLMEKYRIGNLTQGEEHLAMMNVDDPYANDPKRHPVLKVHSQKPFNAETPLALLVENYHTPTELFYVRHHLPVPEIDNAHQLEIASFGDQCLTLSVEELKTKYPQHTVTAVLQCAGNRRSEMNKVKPVKGISWEQGAIGNATWTGPRLRDVLLDAGIKDDDSNENLHVQFEGQDLDPTSMPYGASIPLTKALDPRCDVILAYEMNGEPLSRDHGFPIRVIIPGTVGARWVKWLTKIEISKEESESHWQRNDYKSFSPSADWDSADFSKAPAIQELPVTSVICDPQNQEVVVLDKDGNISLRGYAWSGGGRGIARVDISVNHGKTWHTAQLIDSQTANLNRQWGWTRWQANFPVDIQGELDVWVRAVDSSYNAQPENMDHIWNLRGLMAAAYHKIKVTVQK